MQSRVDVLDEVRDSSTHNGQTLCFQRCIYHYADPEKENEQGYRFIWRDSAERKKMDFGHTRIPDAETLRRLLAMATLEGWYR